MKTFFSLTILLVGVVLLSGCTKVGEYKEGTYFGADEDSGYTAVVYVDKSGNIASVFFDAPYIVYTDGKCPEVESHGTIKCVPTTKQTLGDDYGMATDENAGEWYVQAKIFADKIVEEQGLSWIAWDQEDETVIDVDTLSGVTMSADGMYNAVNTALNQAK